MVQAIYDSVISLPVKEIVNRQYIRKLVLQEETLCKEKLMELIDALP